MRTVNIFIFYRTIAIYSFRFETDSLWINNGNTHSDSWQINYQPTGSSSGQQQEKENSRSYYTY